MLKINEMENVGKARYVVCYYTGKLHNDGSEFYDMAIFSNKVVKDKFIKRLRSQYPGARCDAIPRQN